jgi:hypothetical protein
MITIKTYSYSPPNAFIFTCKLYTLIFNDSKITVFWDVTACSMVDIYQCFGETHCLLLQEITDSNLNIEAETSSETLVSIYQII